MVNLKSSVSRPSPRVEQDRLSWPKSCPPNAARTKNRYLDPEALAAGLYSDDRPNGRFDRRNAPPKQTQLIVNKAGRPYKHENYLGDAVSEWRDQLKLRRNLRLYDARGTAATRLLKRALILRKSRRIWAGL